MPRSATPHPARARAGLPVIAAIPVLALQAAFAAGAQAGDVLFDQGDYSLQGGASPTQQMTVSQDEIADDFDVTDPQGWTITRVMLAVNYTDPASTPPGQPPYLIAFYADAGGRPAATASCEYDAAPGATDYPGMGLNVTVTLPAPCMLTAGRYWMAMSAVLEPPPYSLWIYNAPPAFVLNEPVYRNPDDHWGTGCVDWTPAYSGTCLFNLAGGKPNMVFQLLGTVGMSEVIFVDGFDPAIP